MKSYHYLLLDTKTSKNDAITKMITKYKNNEEIYLKTIQQLQDNNKELLEELLTMREEYALRTSNIEQT